MSALEQINFDLDNLEMDLNFKMGSMTMSGTGFGNTSGNYGNLGGSTYQSRMGTSGFNKGRSANPRDLISKK